MLSHRRKEKAVPFNRKNSSSSLATKEKAYLLE